MVSIIKANQEYRIFKKFSFPFRVNYVIIGNNRVKILTIKIIYERIFSMSTSRKNREKNSLQPSRRKRINRLKTFIVIGAVVLLCTSVILNIILVFKILHLENQFDILYSQTPVVVTQDIVI